ncbi:putative reverse transcriptase domain-containing protein [Tanacetum coccineum]
MPPRMRTRSAARPAAESLGGGTGKRVGRGRRGRRPKEGNDEHVDELNSQGNDQGMRANRGVEGVNGNVEYGGAPDFSTIIAQQLQNLLPAMLAQVSNRGNVENQNVNVVNENVQENVGNAIVNGNRIHGMVAVTEPKTIQKVVQISGALTDEAVRNSLIKKVEKRGSVGNLEERIRVFGLSVPFATPSTHPVGFVAYATTATARGCGNQGNQARGKAFMLGAVEACQDPNIMTGTFTLNNHFATTLFDSGADYSFVSTTFIPLLGLEPSDLGFKYEIKIASGQLVEIDKVIKGCKLEIEGHVFDIDLIPFGHGSFDVIIGMDWLSNYKAEIICHEKVVRIPLPDGKVLRVLGERPEEKARFLMGAKAGDKKQEEIVVVRDFPEVFPDDLSGLPPIQEIEFRIGGVAGTTQGTLRQRFHSTKFIALGSADIIR